jgi:hypothetical protein
MDEAYYKQKKEKAYQVYSARRAIRSPFFKKTVMLNTDGFHHLCYSTLGERRKREQVTRFILLPLGLRILKTATTLQECRKEVRPFGIPGKQDNPLTMKTVEWWGFVAMFVEQDIKVRVVVRKVGGGKLHSSGASCVSSSARRKTCWALSPARETTSRNGSQTSPRV